MRIHDLTTEDPASIRRRFKILKIVQQTTNTVAILIVFALICLLVISFIQNSKDSWLAEVSAHLWKREFEGIFFLIFLELSTLWLVTHFLGLLAACLECPCLTATFLCLNTIELIISYLFAWKLAQHPPGCIVFAFYSLVSCTTLMFTIGFKVTLCRWLVLEEEEEESKVQFAWL